MFGGIDRNVLLILKFVFSKWSVIVKFYNDLNRPNRPKFD